LPWWSDWIEFFYSSACGGVASEAKPEGVSLRHLGKL
jgi:hypothetical protein